MNESLAQLHPLFTLFSFILGCTVGSFLNVCISRWPAGQSVVKPRSRCPQCNNSIAWYDNIPVISWLALRAKCRHCHLPISWIYPLVEVLTGILFLLTYLAFGITIATPIYMGLAAALVVVTFVDLTDWTIPNEITFPGIPLGVAVTALAWLVPGTGLHIDSIRDSLIGLVLGGGSLWSLDIFARLILKKPGMGFGDVKLNAMLGAFLGWQGVLMVILIASVLGSVIGIGLILIAKWAPRPAPTEEGEEEDLDTVGHYLPFGPYLAIAGIIVMLLGPQLFDRYLQFMSGASSSGGYGPLL